MKKKIVAGLITIVVIVGVVMLIGCVEEPPSAPTETPTPTAPTELSLEDSVIVNDISFVVVKYEFADRFIDEYNNTNLPNEGAKFLWLYVKATNIGEVAQYIPESYDVSILYKGTEITRYRVGGRFYLESKEREMYAYELMGGFGKIYPDVSEEGWIIYEVPKNIDMSQAKIRVEFSPKEGYGSEETVTWSF
jgi:hypothetical protein